MRTEPTPAVRAAYTPIVLCPDPACDPANEKLCAACRPAFDARVPGPLPGPGVLGVPRGCEGRAVTSKWEIIGLLVWLPHVTWTYAFCFRSVFKISGRAGGRIISRLFFEIRPFVPALIAGRFICDAINDGTERVGWRIIFLAMDIAVYAIARREKDDDDRWKKRAAKAADKVQDLGHRLVVVPGGAS